MFLDSQLQLSDSQALTATAVGSNTIDLSEARSIGHGCPVCVVFNVEVDADQTTGDEDYTFAVEYSTTADQSSGTTTVGSLAFQSGTPSGGALDADLLVAGYSFAVPVAPVGSGVDERYIGARYTLVGTTPTVTVSAYLADMNMIDVSKVYYADGYAIT